MTDNLVLEHLKAIRANQEDQAETLLEIKGRLGLLEEGYSSISRRVDRIDERIARIERRLELVEV